MARQQKSLQKLAAYRAGTLGTLDRHSGTLSKTGSMRSHGPSTSGLGASSGHATLLVTTVADEQENGSSDALEYASAEPLPAVVVNSSSSSSRAATPPETNALPDVEDDGVHASSCTILYSAQLSINLFLFPYRIFFSSHLGLRASIPIDYLLQ